MRQFDINGPHGAGLAETDSQGRLVGKLQKTNQPSMADALRSWARGNTKPGKAITDRQKATEEAGL